MHWATRLLFLGCATAAAVFGCSSSGDTNAQGSGGAASANAGGSANGGNTTTFDGSGASGGTGPGAGGSTNAGGSGQGGNATGGGGGGGSMCVDTLDANRDRVLKSYFKYLKANATQPQSNGLSSSNVNSVCDVWTKLDPSSRSVFLTITARLQRSILGVDGSSMLCHVNQLYRLTGGQDATQTDPGSCGGGEYNRMIMSMDAELQAVQLAANQHQGALQANGKYDIADSPPNGTFWRDSHDLGGPHGPFDLSDETDNGAPRGQTQYFQDPTSMLANAPLGRQDLMTLVDPYALEMDEDYDCTHNSNPICSYTFYGPICIPMSSEIGTQIYTDSYGDFEANWKPSGCN